MKDLLLSMLRPFGPSGSEAPISAAIAERIRPFVDEIKTDALGNLIAVRRGKGGKRVMFSAHMDSIGYIVLDADKEGFLRSETSLIQTIGRAARNAEGHVIMYADTITDSMRLAIQETERRRKVQMEYNEAHGITPQTIKKSVRDLISISRKVAAEELRMEKDPESMSPKELEKLIQDVTKQMKKAAAELNFEAAAELRDKMVELKKLLKE